MKVNVLLFVDVDLKQFTSSELKTFSIAEATAGLIKSIISEHFKDDSAMVFSSYGFSANTSLETKNNRFPVCISLDFEVDLEQMPFEDTESYMIETEVRRTVEDVLTQSLVPSDPKSGIQIRMLVSKMVETTDTEMLDWLQDRTKGYGKGWVCRDSITGRGMRLHETSKQDAKGTVRKAILAAMIRENIEEAMKPEDSGD